MAETNADFRVILDAFEEAWQNGPRPTLADFLPAGHPHSRELSRELIKMDLEYRLRAGHTCPLAGEYFGIGAGWTREEQAELIALEYQWRWEDGDPEVHREQYVGWFPGIGDLLPSLRPRWNCRACKKMHIPLEAEDASQAECPRCRKVFSRAHLFSAEKAGPNASLSTCDLQLVVPGCKIINELGQGGMGVVFRVQDADLKRNLAVKVLQRRLQKNPDMVRRFVEEAQITGHLQHPGIPPIHKLGTLADGRPFFAMKLIKGRTLAAMLKERESAAADLPRYLGIFEQICQTLAYAHSRGVIHRDLKPLNVMVGAFGEVQLMDWGLAKVLNDQSPADVEAMPAAASVVETTCLTAEEHATQSGWVLGTLAYMAPAGRGELNQISRRSDVFGLGAILCEILTGQPCYAGISEEIRRHAQAGNVQPALERLDRSGQDAGLATLAKRCLSPMPEARPAHAGEVADAVRSHQEKVQRQLLQAERNIAAAEARTGEERRRRRLTVVAAAWWAWYWSPASSARASASCARPSNVKWPKSTRRRRTWPPTLKKMPNG